MFIKTKRKIYASTLSDTSCIYKYLVSVDVLSMVWGPLSQRFGGIRQHELFTFMEEVISWNDF